MARAGLTVERLVRAAAELADEIGFDNVTMSALARRFGVRDASLYSHVRNLTELRGRVALLAAREKSERLALAVAGLSGRDALVAFANAYRRYAHEHPGRYAATQIQVDPELLAESPQSMRGGELVYAMLQGYGLREPDVTDAVRLLRSALHGYILLETGDGFGHPRDVQTSWERALEALHVTLQNWPS
ncbi:TetR/AcrR family transcriptional regulator [Thermomonospora cellulosilytica]|uniref:AcrR family transcriptional regulator n=1 Tax=Thermomonospora cellulosilytica TaxID=1411118 RepID=A0A7W3R621_9ACTN|nr:TetR/AcrR family transcriptional regulator [Thermomonospora cellulosilytica]MBA9001693.1 AcrR family transcriptional regulator [Thermomonospora cellulosilytica]